MTRNSNDFKKLKDKWYKKLKDSGFEDIEQDEDNLKVWSLKLFTVDRDRGDFAAKEEYYRGAGKFLHSHKFKNNFEKSLWEMHVSGQSNRGITKLLRSGGMKITRMEIDAIVKALVRTMLKAYDVRR